MSIRPLALMVACLTLAGAATAQPTSPPLPAKVAPTWSGEVDANLYVFEDEGPLFMPVVSADRGALHLEGRYQYEDRRTVSLWAGRTFEAGTDVHLTVVPMVAAVVGRTNGVAPGYELTIGWKPIELYSESEYVFDASGSDGDFGYTWTELAVRVRSWARLGLSAQRTREHRGARWIDRGVFAAVSKGPVEVSFHWFNVEAGTRFAILGFSLEF